MCLPLGAACQSMSLLEVNALGAAVSAQTDDHVLLNIIHLVSKPVLVKSGKH